MIDYNSSTMVFPVITSQKHRKSLANHRKSQPSVEEKEVLFHEKVPFEVPALSQVLLNDGKYEYIFMFPQMNSVWHGLKRTFLFIPSCPEAAVWVPAAAEPLPDDTPGPAAQGGGGPGRPEHRQLQGQGQKGRCCTQGTTVTQWGMIQYKMLSPQV